MRNELYKLHLPLFFVQAMFSLLPTLSKLVYRYITPEELAFYRISISAVIFFMVKKFVTNQSIQDKKDLFTLSILAFLGVSGNQMLYLKGVSFTKASNAVLTIASIPILTFTFSIIFKYEKFLWRKLSGIFLGFIGISLVLLKELKTIEFDKGVLLIIMNSSLYSLYLVFSKNILKKYKPITVVTYIFILGAIEIIPLFYLFRGSFSFNFYEIEALKLTIAIVVFCTVIPYFINIFVLKDNLSSIVGFYTYLQPIIGSLIAFVILGEKIILKQILSLIFIVSGVYLVSKK